MRASAICVLWPLVALVCVTALHGQGPPASQPAGPSNGPMATPAQPSAPSSWPPTLTIPSTPPGAQTAAFGAPELPYDNFGNPQLPTSEPLAMPSPPPQAFAAGGGSTDFFSGGFDAPTRGIVISSGLDSWHGIADRGNFFNRPSSNDGGSFGFNYGTRLGRVSDLTGIGFQFGASYGVYDWNGRPFNSGVLTTTEAQQQTFVTTGFFKKFDDHSFISYGLVHDWMINQAFGAFAVNPTLGQWRGQISFSWDPVNEVGVWATVRDKGSSNLDAFGNTVITQSMNQANLFWHRKWELGADSWIWIGLPQDSRVNPFATGSLGNLLLGGTFTVPLSESVALYSNLQYMHPSAAPGPAASGEAAWYVAFGLQYTIGAPARTATVAGNPWLPLMPLGNNGNFLVDAARVP